MTQLRVTCTLQVKARSDCIEARVDTFGGRVSKFVKAPSGV